MIPYPTSGPPPANSTPGTPLPTGNPPYAHYPGQIYPNSLGVGYLYGQTPPVNPNLPVSMGIPGAGRVPVHSRMIQQGGEGARVQPSVVVQQQTAGRVAESGVGDDKKRLAFQQLLAKLYEANRITKEESDAIMRESATKKEEDLMQYLKEKVGIDNIAVAVSAYTAGQQRKQQQQQRQQPTSQESYMQRTPVMSLEQSVVAQPHLTQLHNHDTSGLKRPTPQQHTSVRELALGRQTMEMSSIPTPALSSSLSYQMPIHHSQITPQAAQHPPHQLQSLSQMYTIPSQHARPATPVPTTTPFPPQPPPNTVIPRPITHSTHMSVKPTPGVSTAPANPNTAQARFLPASGPAMGLPVGSGVVGGYANQGTVSMAPSTGVLYPGRQQPQGVVPATHVSQVPTSSSVGVMQQQQQQQQQMTTPEQGKPWGGIPAGGTSTTGAGGVSREMLLHAFGGSFVGVPGSAARQSWALPTSAAPTVPGSSVRGVGVPGMTPVVAKSVGMQGVGVGGYQNVVVGEKRVAQTPPGTEIPASKRPAVVESVTGAGGVGGGANKTAAKPKRRPIEDPNAPEDREGDVVQGAEIELAEEQEALLGQFKTVKNENETRGGAGAAGPVEPVDSKWLNVGVVHEKLSRVLRRNGIVGASPECLEMLVRGMEVKYEEMMRKMVRSARHRGGPGEARKGAKITTDVRSKLREIKKAELEKLASKERAERAKLEKLAETATKKDLAGNKELAAKVEKVKRERLLQNETAAANFALSKAFGGLGFEKFKEAAEKEKKEKARREKLKKEQELAASQKAKSAAGGSGDHATVEGNGEGEEGGGGKQKTKAKVTEVKISVRDIMGAMERDSGYCRARSLQRLYLQKRPKDK